MIIRCWGARGSVPVSGKEYLKYGGDTPCIEIRSKEDEIIIIDAGSGIRRLGNQLLAENRFSYSMLFTHAHWDHLIGFPFFKPIYMKKTKITMYGCPYSEESVKHMISRIMSHPNFPVDFDDIHANIVYDETCGTDFSIHSLRVTSIPISHPNQGVGFKFVEDGKTFVFITDNELSFKHPGGLDYEDYVAFSMDADILIHDAEFIEQDYKKVRTWGHSVYLDTLQLALDAKVKKLGLYHHNQDRTDTAIDEMIDKCQEIIQKQSSCLECFAVSQDMEMKL
ncbi:MAG: MBL fold metallo-hydrolase [Deltaproteobacteria bacterium]|nr:MBL fold metallo-hydrolase [Deltaproteobacteria bacterium]